MTESYEERYWQAMRSRYEELTGSRPEDASDIAIRLRVLAGQLAGLQQSLDEMFRQAFPATSSGSCLDAHAAARGLSRKAAVAAAGSLTFSREQAAATDLVIPAGTAAAASLADEVSFATTEEVILTAGQTQVTAPAACQQPGKTGNAAAGAVTVMIDPPQGITAVTNGEPFTGGEEAETDEELRARLADAYRQVNNGTNTAFYRQAALETEGVFSAHVLPRSRGRGTVDVIVSGRGQPVPEAALTALESRLAAQKEINVDIVVKNADAKPVDLTVEVAPLPQALFPALKESCAAALTDALNASAVGEKLRLGALIHRLWQVTGLENCRILSPAADVEADEDEVIRPGTITVNQMGVTA